MKREEIKTIFPDASDEQLKAVLDLNGADVEKVKSKVAALEADVKEKKEAFDNLTNELNALKESSASADDWKTKFEELQADNLAKEKQAEADRLLKEKQDNINSRFDAVVGGKAFTHDAIRASYLKSFGDALESKEYEGKSDADIFHALTKDDAAAFKGVQVVQLKGGNKGIGGKYSSKEEILAIKDGVTRRNEMAAHPQFFPELNS